MFDKKMFTPISAEEAEARAIALGYSSLSAFFTETGVYTRTKVTSIRKSGEADPCLSSLMHFMEQSLNALRDGEGNVIPTAELFKEKNLIPFVLRDGFAAPVYKPGDIIFALPYQGGLPIDGEWIIRYQGRETFGRLMVMPDEAIRFSRIGGGTEPLIFGLEHSDKVTLVGRALFHVNRIGA